MNRAGTASKFKCSAGDFEAASIQKFCDVVMKGGITSGVVYPLAICKLATSYVIKNIGGTSVGAIAAAITAAAEYRRRSGSGDGYVELSKLPDFLGRPGTLLALFAADPQARRLLKVALTLIGSEPFINRLARLLAQLAFQYFWILLLSIAVVFGFIVAAASPPAADVLWRYLLVAVVLGGIAGFVLVALALGYETVVVLDRNNFGWCHGYSRDYEARVASVADVTQLDAKHVPPLFNWLEAFIAQTAGRDRTVPLTFGDLWNAKDPSWHAHSEGEHGIDFRMVTTCLTLGRPFQLPFDPTDPISQKSDETTDRDDDGYLRPSVYFRKEDIAQYFSSAVVEHMVRYGKKTELVTSGTYYRFPAAERVPIVVATRFSMSFPVLFCAFPLYACDATGKMQRIWFSDGGITSNFPIQFFDSPLPLWPTFAIDLLGGAPKSAKEPHLEQYVPGAVFIESEAPRGTVNPWDTLDCGAARGNVLALASSILDAARSWQDVTLAGLPGNASRIVGIRLSDEQGGLNLKMKPETICAMSGKGLAAGTKLVDVFATGEPEAPGWKAHRWIRYRATMGAITRWLGGFATGYAPFTEQPCQECYADLITEKLPAEKQGAVCNVTEQLASVPQDQTFFEIERPPIAVLPMRPVV